MNSLCECLRGLEKIPHLIQDNPWVWADVIKSVPKKSRNNTVAIFDPKTVGFGDLKGWGRELTKPKWNSGSHIGLIVVRNQKVSASHFRIVCIPKGISSPSVIREYLQKKSTCQTCSKRSESRKINNETGKATCIACFEEQRQLHRGTQAAPVYDTKPVVAATWGDNNHYYQDDSDDSFGNYDPYDDDCPDRYQPDWDIINEHYGNID